MISLQCACGAGISVRHRFRVREEQRVILTFMNWHECPQEEKAPEKQPTGFALELSSEMEAVNNADH